MRILFLTNSDEGAYKFRREFLEELLKDNEVFLSSIYGQYVEKLEELGCKYIRTDFNRKGTNPFKDLKLLKRYIKMLEEVKPDCVLTYTIKPNVYGGLACQIKKIPYITTITGLGSSIENGGLLSLISLNLYKIALRKAKKVFFQNTYNLDFLVNKKVVKKDITQLVPGSGVNLKQFKILDYPDDKQIYFAYAGRVLKEKGFDQYIDVAKYIKNKYPNTHFLVCGGIEDDYKQIIDELSKDNIIEYCGNVVDMVTNIYSKIHCLIHPSFYAEGLSNVLLESLACARPIITTDKPGCKELVIDGEDGYLIKQKDSGDLINKVEMFLSLTNNQKKQMGLNGRKFVEEKYDRNIVINEYIKAIKE